MTYCAGCKEPIASNQDHDLCDICMDLLMGLCLSFVISKDMATCIICGELRCIDSLAASEGDYVCKEGCSPPKQFQTTETDKLARSSFDKLRVLAQLSTL